MSEFGNEIVKALLKDLDHATKKKDKAVFQYALELMDTYNYRANKEGRDAVATPELEKWLLEGADDWSQYSYGGCSLIATYDIIERIGTDKQLRKYEEDGCAWHDSEGWLDDQTKYLIKAKTRIIKYYRLYKRNYISKYGKNETVNVPKIK